MPSIEYYTSLIPSWNATRPNFRAMVTGLVEPIVNAQAALFQVRDSYDLDTAVGVQLDQVGEWIGRTRQIVVPITGVFFSFDDAALGFDLGIWEGPYNPSTGVVTLDDGTYRALLKAKALANLWDGTILGTAPAYAALTNVPVLVLDNQDMTMTIAVAGSPPPIILSLLLGGYVPLKPMGVRVNYLVAIAPLFGFDNNNTLISGFDTGAWGVPY